MQTSGPADAPAAVAGRGGELKAALSRAIGLLQENPAMAERQARDLLRVYPDLDPALQVLGSARRLQGRPLDALAVLEPLANRHGGSADVLHELGVCLGAAGRGDEAIAVLEKAVAIDSAHREAWRSLGDQLSAAGHEARAQKAWEKHLALSTRHPELAEPAKLLRKAALPRAERLVREVLKRDPTDVVAIRMLATIGVKVGQLEDAKNLYRRCLELAPGFHVARHGYAVALLRSYDLDEALVQVDRLLAAEPDNPNYLVLKGTVLVRKGDHEPALALYERLLAHYPQHSGAHLNYGHTLKTVGRLAEAVAAYRKSIDLGPSVGEAWWSLANLKTLRFDDADIAAMRRALRPEGEADEQAHLCFALGKALEDRGEWDASFENYRRGNEIRGRQQPYSPKINVVNTARQIRVCTKDFFRERKGWGCQAPDPVFIVGLPRAGSTLLEQILASHSLVEGTAELPDIIAMSRRLGRKSRRNPASDYPEVLASLSEGDTRKLGERYLESTAVQRRGKPYFIDKMPNNFQHIGLIHLVLPNAKIIDARRHPMAGCFSCYKQLFARGQTFSYDLTDLGRYYRDYVALMDHWDEVLPGRVLRVRYEDMVRDTEVQVRRLLEYCGLEFEERCLRFYETERAIRTPSAEQVRKPVYREGLEHWRHYEKHLGPLRDALGPVLDRYPVD